MAAQITGGVDTHLDVHVVAARGELGALVGVESFPTTPAGYGALLGWLGSHGEVVVVGVEGTGSYRRGPGPPSAARRCRGGRGRPSESAASPPAGQVRPA